MLLFQITTRAGCPTVVLPADIGAHEVHCFASTLDLPQQTIAGGAGLAASRPVSTVDPYAELDEGRVRRRLTGPGTWTAGMMATSAFPACST